MDARSPNSVSGSESDAAAFSPALARFEATAPSPLGHAALHTVLALVAATLLWAALAPVDIVAVADGKLVPSGYLKIVQIGRAHV